MANIITIYFSMKGETIAPGMKLVNLDKGHTAQAAEFIQEAVGGELFEIETVKTYNPDHFAMIQEAKEEIEKNEMPELKRLPENLEGKSVVFLGFPNWWNQLPMPVISFLNKVDLSGKKIIPFNTSEGSGAGKGMNQLKKICNKSEIATVSEWKGSAVDASEDKIKDWARNQIK
ncbi:hypothetical protein P261_02451 [Lachnospiraceae bacterium TWA4]|nr:hypothetical protein P261_02451 [Lachnospiraceae bacterium TWA4]